MVRERNFSVLMPVYHKDSPIFFDESLSSIYTNQIIKPSQIVIVVDGPIGNGILNIIEQWISKIPSIIKVVKLTKNVGLGKALSRGLDECKFELIARMDSDDIARKDRFEKQLNFFNRDPELIICGSNISEFIEDPSSKSSERLLPENMNEIQKFARLRNPINHPAVMFKKSFITEAGGYIHMPFFEDYYLWARCLNMNFKMYNIQENLVHMRGGNPQLLRRSGLAYAKFELNFLKVLLSIKFFKYYQFIFVLLIRFSVRLAPIFLVKKAYGFVRKN